MRLEDIGAIEDREAFIALYGTAFPREERKPFAFMEELARQGKMEMLAVMDGERFVGLAITLLAKEIVILDYFAIAPAVRGRGYGGQALGLLIKRYGGRRLILEIEMEDPRAENALYRVKRKEFYIRNGIKETGIYAHVYHTDLELLSADGRLSFGEYVRAMEVAMGAEHVAKLRPRQIFKDPTGNGKESGRG